MADKAAKPNKKPVVKAKAAAPKRAAKVAKTEAPKPTILVKAYARNLRISPRKMRLLTNLVKGMRVADALTQLHFTNKKGAEMLSKLLLSAAANAENNFSLNRENLFIKTITCDMGEVLQRSFPRARGSAFIIRHKLAHVNVTLEERGGKKQSKSVMPKAVKKDKPVITQEGSVGVPEEATEKIAKKPKVKETHLGTERTDVEEKTSPTSVNK